MEKLVLTEKDQALIEEASQELEKSSEINISHQNASEFKEISFKLKDLYKRLEEMRLEYTKPLRDEVQRINEKFSIVKQIDQRSKDIIKAVFQFEQAEKKRLAEEKRRQLLEQVKQARTGETPSNPTQSHPEPVETVKTRTVWKSEIVDESLVPRQYLSVDANKVQLAIKAGVTQIPGLKITKEPQPIRR